jgi:hypothetical protein
MIQGRTSGDMTLDERLPTSANRAPKIFAKLCIPIQSQLSVLHHPPAHSRVLAPHVVASSSGLQENSSAYYS